MVSVVPGLGEGTIKVDWWSCPECGKIAIPGEGFAWPQNRCPWNVCSMRKKRACPVKERIVHWGEVVKWLLKRIKCL